jgi:hypothetical protein
MNNTFLLSIYLPGYTISIQGAKIVKNNKIMKMHGIPIFYTVNA